MEQRINRIPDGLSIEYGFDDGLFRGEFDSVTIGEDYMVLDDGDDRLCEIWKKECDDSQLDVEFPNSVYRDAVIGDDDSAENYHRVEYVFSVFEAYFSTNDIALSQEQGGVLERAIVAVLEDKPTYLQGLSVNEMAFVPTKIREIVEDVLRVLNEMTFMSKYQTYREQYATYQSQSECEIIERNAQSLLAELSQDDILDAVAGLGGGGGVEWRMMIVAEGTENSDSGYWFTIDRDFVARLYDAVRDTNTVTTSVVNDDTELIRDTP